MNDKIKDKNRQEYYSCLLKCRELTLEDINKLIHEYANGNYSKKAFEDRWIHSYAMAFKMWCWDYNSELFKSLVRLNELYGKLK